MREATAMRSPCTATRESLHTALMTQASGEKRDIGSVGPDSATYTLCKLEPVFNPLG